MNGYIYADCAATTPVRQEVLDAMLPYFSDKFTNPSGLYDPSFACKVKLEKTREIIAESLSCKKNEIYFTSGGTESNNWAICLGMWGKDGTPHVITSKIEHHSVLDLCEHLSDIGKIELTLLDVTEDGMVDLHQLESSIKNNTSLITIMTANNEIGTIQHIEEIGKIALKYGITFHTDAVQAYGHIRIPVSEYGISMLSASAHKFNGPKGIGFIYISKEIDKKPLLYGGGQESGLRAGTENVPSIIGMGEAARISYLELDKTHEIVRAKRDVLIKRLSFEIEGAYVNGGLDNRLSNNINLSFEGVISSKLINYMNKKGVCASSGSACNSTSLVPSHVLKAIGRSDELALGALRLTIDSNLTDEQLDRIVEVVKEAVEYVRDM